MLEQEEEEKRPRRNLPGALLAACVMQGGKEVQLLRVWGEGGKFDVS